MNQPHKVNQRTDELKSEFKLIAIPMEAGRLLERFLLDKGHGSLTLNVQEGVIRSYELKIHGRL